jgi:hypothetical protein
VEGAALVLDTIGFAKLLEGAALVITGEGVSINRHATASWWPPSLRAARLPQSRVSR